MDIPTTSATLTWWNVGLAFSFVAFNATISKIYNLGIGVSLLTAAVRCIIQLALVASLLQSVFETNNPWAVGGIAREWNFGLDAWYHNLHCIGQCY